MTIPTNYKSYFDEYIKTVFQLENDIRFWKHFLTISIDKYKAENPVNKWISQSGFSLYNINTDEKNTWLYVSNETLTIEIDDLTIQSSNFFVWIMNLSLIRLYNSTELLMLRAIRYKYFPVLEDPIIGKKETNKVIEQIKKYLLSTNTTVDTKNNRYLISFLKINSGDFKLFCANGVNSINWKTTWENFYELISILRNVITHHGMLVSQSVRNELKSIAGDLFLHYFDQPVDNKATELLKPKDEHLFLNFADHINEFAGNTTKFIAQENDLKFLGLRPA